MISELLVLLVALLGIIFGYILALIAPEELRAGKNYLRWGRRMLFLVVFFFINYSLYFIGWYYIIPFSILAVILFVLEIVKTRRIYEIFNYIIFVVPYFFIEEKIALAVLIFLYGFPTGTLLRRVLNKE